MGIGDWGLGIGDWGLGIGRNPQSPNPQSPIPNPQSPIPNNNLIVLFFQIKYIYIKIIYFLKLDSLNQIKNYLFKGISITLLLTQKYLYNY